MKKTIIKIFILLFCTILLFFAPAIPVSAEEGDDIAYTKVTAIVDDTLLSKISTVALTFYNSTIDKQEGITLYDYKNFKTKVYIKEGKYSLLNVSTNNYKLNFSYSCEDTDVFAPAGELTVYITDDGNNGKLKDKDNKVGGTIDKEKTNEIYEKNGLKAPYDENGNLVVNTDTPSQTVDEPTEITDPNQPTDITKTTDKTQETTPTQEEKPLTEKEKQEKNAYSIAFIIVLIVVIAVVLFIRWRSSAHGFDKEAGDDIEQSVYDSDSDNDDTDIANDDDYNT